MLSNDTTVEKMKTAISGKDACRALQDSRNERRGDGERLNTPIRSSSRAPLRPKIRVRFHVPGKCMRREGGFSTFIMQRELGCDEGWRQK